MKITVTYLAIFLAAYCSAYGAAYQYDSADRLTSVSYSMATLSRAVNASNDVTTEASASPLTLNLSAIESNSATLSINHVTLPPESISVFLMSNNTSLIPKETLSITGTGAERTISFSVTPGVSEIGKVNIIANDGTVSTSANLVIDLTASVTGTYVFYNNSAYDGENPVANSLDDNAIAPDKQALLPGNVALFTNYTSHSRGLNGILIDIADLPGIPSQNDFSFKTGNNNNPENWSVAPSPVSITVRSGEGVNGSDRVCLIWNDATLDGNLGDNEAISKAWIEVTVKATINTGLASDYTFYFGNAPGESGNSNTDARVDLTDQIGARNNPHTFQNPSSISDVYDYNRNARVDLGDEVIPRNHGTTFLTALRLIDLSGVEVNNFQSLKERNQSVENGHAIRSNNNDDEVALVGNPVDSMHLNMGNANTHIRIQRIDGEAIIISLHNAEGDWFLQSSQSLLEPNWLLVDDSVTVKNDEQQFQIRINNTQSLIYFRAVRHLDDSDK